MKVKCSIFLNHVNCKYLTKETYMKPSSIYKYLVHPFQYETPCSSSSNSFNSSVLVKKLNHSRVFFSESEKKYFYKFDIGNHFQDPNSGLVHSLKLLGVPVERSEVKSLGFKVNTVPWGVYSSKKSELRDLYHFTLCTLYTQKTISVQS